MKKYKHTYHHICPITSWPDQYHKVEVVIEYKSKNYQRYVEFFDETEKYDCLRALVQLKHNLIEDLDFLYNQCQLDPKDTICQKVFDYRPNWSKIK